MSEYKLVKDYPINNYKCGLKAGDKVELVRDIIIKDHNNKPTGRTYKKGEIWTVLPAAKEEPVVLWLLQADGRQHTWDDDNMIFETFRRAARLG